MIGVLLVLTQAVGDAALLSDISLWQWRCLRHGPLAGLVDAMVGGGGMIRCRRCLTPCPARRWQRSSAPNKFSAIAGTAAATCWRYARSIPHRLARLPPRHRWQPCLFAFLGARWLRGCRCLLTGAAGAGAAGVDGAVTCGKSNWAPSTPLWDFGQIRWRALLMGRQSAPTMVSSAPAPAAFCCLPAACAGRLRFPAHRPLPRW